MVKEPEKISVLISIYNGESTAEQSIKTITSQTYTNLEILIIDDGSTDRTFEICKSLELEDSRIKVFKNQDNVGLTKCLNILISHATGSFIARHDIDDYSKKDRFKIQLSFLQKRKLDVVYSRARIIKLNKIIPGISFYFPKNLVVKFKNPFIHGTLLAKKEAILGVGKYDERFKYSQDYKLVHDLIKTGFKVKILRKSLYNLNMENNISQNFRTQQEYFANCVRKNKNP
jgi:glycosyltransferase involved in cell wall biosynthesis